MTFVIFDCDGTLVDSQHMIVAAMNEAFARAKLDVPARGDVLSVVGLSLEGAIQRLLPEGERHRSGLIAGGYKESFAGLRTRKAHEEPLYPGIRALLEDLSGREDVMLAIATGKSSRGVAAILEREGLMACFSSIQTADTHPSKPHPSMILQALHETGAPRERTIMIGDTTYDMEMALSAGVLPVGAGWGYHAPHSLQAAGAHTVVEESPDLARELERIIALLGAPQ